jgi:hypothetical protein
MAVEPTCLEQILRALMGMTLILLIALLLIVLI